jgi:hypothetical protein
MSLFLCRCGPQLGLSTRRWRCCDMEYSWTVQSPRPRSLRGLKSHSSSLTTASSTPKPPCCASLCSRVSIGRCEHALLQLSPTFEGPSRTPTRARGCVSGPAHAGRRAPEVCGPGAGSDWCAPSASAAGSRARTAGTEHERGGGGCMQARSHWDATCGAESGALSPRPKFSSCTTPRAGARLLRLSLGRRCAAG